MRLRCEVCGGTDFVKADGSYRCRGCGMRYDIGELRALMAAGPDEDEGTRAAGGWTAGRETTGVGDDAWHAGGEQDRVHGVGRDASMGPSQGRVRRGPLDALPTSVLMIGGVVVFVLCFLIRRSGFSLRVLGMSTQEWLIISYTALLIASLEGRDSKVMGVLTTAFAILTIVVLSLQVHAWAQDGSFCLLRLPGSEASVTQDLADDLGRSEGSREVAPGDLGAFEAWTVSGNGDDAVPMDCRPMPCLIDVAYTGEGDFTLASKDADGGQRDLLVDATGPYEGQVTTYGDEEDVASLEVRADGAWELRFAPMDAVARIELDERGTSDLFHGDRVVYVDEKLQGTLGFAHRGEGDFTVRAVTGTGSELLVDATGDYEGTVAWGGPSAFLMVSADGDWSLSRS